MWSLHIRPDEQVLVSGSADKEVKFWEFERDAVPEDDVILFSSILYVMLIYLCVQSQPKKSLTLVHTRTLKMSDDVLSVRYSPNGKLLAVSLLDSTVKIFYQDTLKFFLSLYGHKVSFSTLDRHYLY